MKMRHSAGKPISSTLAHARGRLIIISFGDQEWQSGFRSNSDNSRYNIGGNAGISMGRAGKMLIDASSFHNNAGIPVFRCDDVLDPSCPTSTTPLEPNRFNNKDEKPAGTPLARQITDSNYLRASLFGQSIDDVYLAARFFLDRSGKWTSMIRPIRIL